MFCVSTTFRCCELVRRRAMNTRALDLSAPHHLDRPGAGRIISTGPAPAASATARNRHRPLPRGFAGRRPSRCRRCAPKATPSRRSARMQVTADTVGQRSARNSLATYRPKSASSGTRHSTPLMMLFAQTPSLHHAATARVRVAGDAGPADLPADPARVASQSCYGAAHDPQPGAFSCSDTLTKRCEGGHYEKPEMELYFHNTELM